MFGSRLVHICQLPTEALHYFKVTTQGGNCQWGLVAARQGRPPPTDSSAFVSSCLAQKANHIKMSLLSRKEQGCISHPAVLVLVGPHS